jgi:predicted ATPase
MGGVGKSRLALTVARKMVGSFEHGVWWVPLAGVGVNAPAPADTGPLLEEARSVSSGDPLVNAISKALGVFYPRDGDQVDQLIDYLSGREILLVLDNFEHLAERSTEFLLSLLQASPDLVVMVTSRRRLNLQAEHDLELLFSMKRI